MQGKMEEISRLFESRGLDVLALSENKFTGKGEPLFGGVKGRKSKVREGVCTLVREVRKNGKKCRQG